MVEFQIPTTPLGQLTAQALTELGLAAAAEFETLTAAVTPDTITDEQLAQLRALREFTGAVDTELSGRTARATEFAALTAEPETLEVEVPVQETVTASVEEVVEATGTASNTRVAVTQVVSPTLAQIAPLSPNLGAVASAPNARGDAPMFTMIAAPDTGVAAGSELADWEAVGEAFQNRSRAYQGASSAQQHGVAVIRREFPEEFTLGLDTADQKIKAIFDKVRNPQNLLDNALTAGIGWCAPSETVYSTCNQITISGIANLPEIGARRGGIRHNTGIQFDGIFGSGTGYNILTEAQVIADTAKTCVALPCPTFVDDRLKVSVLCLTGDILQNRAYPEFVAEFMQGAVAAQAHNVNRQVLADMVSDSTAVTLAASAPWTNDNSVISQVLSAAELAAVDERYRLRMEPTAVIEQIWPLWLRAQMRADWLRRNATYTLSMADSMIESLFSERNVRVQWVYDFQDAFTSGGVTGAPPLPGADTAITSLPVSVSFLAYPAGTWVLARQDVIRIESIYDSTNITTNKVTQLFVEDGFRAMRFCPISRYYTVPICPTGNTGGQQDVTCA